MSMCAGPFGRSFRLVSFDVGRVVPLSKSLWWVLLIVSRVPCSHEDVLKVSPDVAPSPGREVGRESGRGVGEVESNIQLD